MYTGPAIMYFINLIAVIGFSIFFMLKADTKLTMYALFPLPLLAFIIYFVNSIIDKKSEKQLLHRKRIATFGQLFQLFRPAIRLDIKEKQQNQSSLFLQLNC